MYDDQNEYERAIVNCEIALSERNRVPTVKKRMTGYSKNCRRLSWRRVSPKPCQSSERMEPGTYAPVVRPTDKPISLNPTGKKTGLSELGTTASVDMSKLLPGRFRELYNRTARLEHPGQEELSKTENGFG